MKTSSAKQKARRLQNWVCQKISVLLDIPWGYEDYKLIQPRIMGQSGVDIILRGKAEIFPFDVECKSTEKINLYKDIKQAKKNNIKKNRYWLIVHKKNKEKPIVVMDADTFFTLGVVTNDK